MLVPLTPLDATWDSLAVTLCWVYELKDGSSAEDTAAHGERLREAGERVVRGWPWLAGVPQSLSPGRWAIDVPDDLDETSKSRSLVGFSSTTRSEPYHVAAGLSSPLSPLSSSPSGLSSVPDVSLFCPSSVPFPIAEYAKQQLPLLQLHVTFFTDAMAVGITLPHGVVDGAGYGMVARALNAALHGDEWTVPPPFETNPLGEALEDLAEDKTVQTTEKGALPPLEGWATPSFGAALRLFSSVAVELFWWKAETRSIFLRQAVVDRLVEKVKEEVKRETGGNEFVSTGDIIAAWFLKANESSSSGSVAASAVYNIRSLLSTHTSTPSASSPSSNFSVYPHNAVAPYDLFSPLPFSTLSTTSLASLSLALRRNFALQHTLPTLQAYYHKLKANSGTDKSLFIPHRNWPTFFSSPWPRTPTHRWMFTNQASLGVADLAVPGKDGKNLPLLSYHLQNRSPLALDHGVEIQRIEGVGITVGSMMRRSRWKGVERAVKQLEEDFQAAAVA
ncbi:hypothetical protein JCM6882_008007 [Rhodosporidiobolus microsporus]